MSILLREVKCESSSSRQRDVMELMFTCDMVMSWSPCRLDGVVSCAEDVADPTGAARRLGSEKSGITLVRAAAAQQWVRITTIGREK